jgi:indoleamine 2,3-dioxygenase
VNPYAHDQFWVGPDNGFLPREDPLAELPKEYEAMESLLDRMRLQRTDGSRGLLYTGEFEAAVDKELPEYDLGQVKDPRLANGEFGR